MKAATLLRWIAVVLLGAAGAAHAAFSPGVRAEYFNYGAGGTPGFSGQGALLRVENNINVSNETASPAPGIVSADYYAVRYIGHVLIPTTGLYKFTVVADDGIRLYVDCNHDGVFDASEKLVDSWTDKSTVTTFGTCSNLSAGWYVSFRIEHYKTTGPTTLQFKWNLPSNPVATVIVPTSDGTQGLASDWPPSLSSISIGCDTSYFDVAFSEQVTSASAQARSNYSLTGGYSVNSAVLQADGRTVRLTVSPRLATNETLSVSNVNNRALPPSTIDANSSLPVIPIPSGLVGVYYDQNGSAGAYFTGDTWTRTDSTIDFNWGSGAPVSGMSGSNYSVRWSGLLKVPTTGIYNFLFSADNSGRLYVDGVPVIPNWTSSGSGAITLSAGSYVNLVAEHYQGTGSASAKLSWKTPGSASYVTVPASNLFHSNCSVASFLVSVASATPSTCTPAELSVTALDANDEVMTGYTGTVTLSTSTLRGDWAPFGGTGSFDNGSANDGLATYTFAAADAGLARLVLFHTLAQDVVVTARDASVAGSSSTSPTLAFRDNAFLFTEDAAGKISGSNIAVAGRPHDYTVSVMKKDPATGSCSVAADFSGSRSLKMWRTDSNGSWTAPTVVSPALTIPSAVPSSNNLTLNFSAGTASFNLGTTDIGRYALNLRDDSLSYAATAINGSSNTLTVRPFTLMVWGIGPSNRYNPASTDEQGGILATAGEPFFASLYAFRWTANADANNDGIPDAGASYAAVTTGTGLTASFNTPVTLVADPVGQLPAGGTAGTLSDSTFTSYSGGSSTLATLKYSEVGSFTLKTSGLVTNFLGSGIALDAVVFGPASSQQQTRVGRFIPAGFTLSGTSVTHRSTAGCAPASTFTYLDEAFDLNYTLSAVNAQGPVTTKYNGAYAKLNLTSAAEFLPAASGFQPGARLSLLGAAGTWINGVSSAARLRLSAGRASAPDGPHAATFGIDPVDDDSVRITAPYDIDTDAVAGNDRHSIGTVALRHGRLRLSNAIGSQDRNLGLPLKAQHWDGSNFITNTDDSCTSIAAANVSFGNHRRTLAATDTSVVSSPVRLTGGTGTLLVSKPASGHSGTVDVVLSLDTTATAQTCLQPWTANKAATTGASLLHLRGTWCGSSAYKDPAARASFGLYRGADKFIFQRENP